MSRPGRAAVLATWQAVLDALKADESLPLPYFGPAGLSGGDVSFTTGSAAEMTAVERALPCEFTPRIEGPDRERPAYVLAGEINGRPVTISAYADRVAERKVTGVTTVEQVEWVRKGAAPEEGEQ